MLITSTASIYTVSQNWDVFMHDQSGLCTAETCNNPRLRLLRAEHSVPIIFSGALAFMKSSAFGAVLGVEIKADNCNAFVASLSSDANMCKSVFGLKNPKTFQVTAFFLQLIALRLIEFKVRNNMEMICVCVQHCSPIHHYKYDDPLCWKGFAFRTSKRGRGTIPFEMVLKRHNEVAALLQEY